MIIYKEVCVGCGQCQPRCPSGAISFLDRKSTVDQELCFECGTCLRIEVCPVDAIHESPHVFEFPRALRKHFSDPCVTHAATGVGGRGTEECKTNDVSLRCGPGEVGIAIEVGRPTLGMGLRDIQKITRTLAQSGIHEIEPNNPIHSMIQNPVNGDLKPELLNERVLSAIIEMKVQRDQLRNVLKTIKKVIPELDSVFTLCVFTMLEPGLTVPLEILGVIESEGFSCRPNAKINMGLGKAWE
ncbi:DUF362 domain-containing protein [Thermodesulfobacteriota bacterium]